MRHVQILATALLVASSATVFAGEPITGCSCKPAETHPMLRVTYPIEGISIPALSSPKEFKLGEEESEAILPCCPFPVPLFSETTTPTSNGKMLEDMIEKLIHPACWKSAGGSCNIECTPDGKSMTVNAPADVQTRIASILDSLRKNRKLKISVETRLLSVSDDFFKGSHLREAFGLGSNVPVHSSKLEQTSCRSSERLPTQPTCGLKSVVLSDWQVYMLMIATQNDERYSVMQAPRVTVDNGQTAHRDICDVELPITGLKFESIDGHSRVVTEARSVDIGVRFEMCPVLAADQKSVSIRWRGANSFPTCGHCDAYPFWSEDDRNKVRWLSAEFSDKPTTPLESDKPSNAVPNALPKIVTISAEVCATIPCDGTFMIYGGKVESIEEVKRSTPLLGDIPLVNSLFTSAETVHHSDHFIWLITPRIAQEQPETPKYPSSAEEEEASVPLPISPRSPSALPPVPTKPNQDSGPTAEKRAEKMAAKLMRKYHEAFAAGDLEKAREYAQDALELDPGCFKKWTSTQLSVLQVPFAIHDNANDFWSKQTKEDIMRDLITPYLQMPQWPTIQPPAQSPSGR